MFVQPLIRMHSQRAVIMLKLLNQRFMATSTIASTTTISGDELSAEAAGGAASAASNVNSNATPDAVSFRKADQQKSF
jgi:hypothetical protein